MYSVVIVNFNESNEEDGVADPFHRLLVRMSCARTSKLSAIIGDELIRCPVDPRKMSAPSLANSKDILENVLTRNKKKKKKLSRPRWDFLVLSAYIEHQRLKSRTHRRGI